MDLIQRYLQAVKPLLPREQQDDILAELSEDLRSQIEGREAALDRALDEDEVAAIIKKRGRPIKVASAYRPQQYLIGPAWFPLYRFVLKLVMLWVQLPVMLFAIVPTVYFASPHPSTALLGLARQLPTVAITTFGIITVMFVCLERFQSSAAEKPFEDWDLRTLPRRPVSQIQPHLRSVAIAELVSGIVFPAGWVYCVWFHPSVNLDVLHIALAPVWRNNFWPVLLLFGSGIPTGCIGLFRPSLTSLLSSLRLAINGSTLILIAVLLQAGTWIDITSTKLFAAQVAGIIRGYNQGIRAAFLVVTIIALIHIAQEVHRIVNAKTLRPWTANGLAAS